MWPPIPCRSSLCTSTFGGKQKCLRACAFRGILTLSLAFMPASATSALSTSEISPIQVGSWAQAVSFGYPAAYISDGYERVVVTNRPGATIREFYRIRQDICDPMASEIGRPDCLRWVLRWANRYGYGPTAIDAAIRLEIGQNYYFFPVCNRPIRWSDRHPINIGFDTRRVELACPR